MDQTPRTATRKDRGARRGARSALDALRKIRVWFELPYHLRTRLVALPFARFFRRSLLAITIWLPVILGVSYGLYSSLSPLAAVIEIKHFELLFLAGLIIFIILQFTLVRIFEKMFGRNGENDKPSA